MQLERLTSGMLIPFGGDRAASVPADLASAFQAGDMLVVCQTDGALLHIPADIRRAVSDDISAASAAFKALSSRSDGQIVTFFEEFVVSLENDAIWSRIIAANDCDVARAIASGRPTGRLALSPSARDGMIRGLRGWAASEGDRHVDIDTRQHDGWTLSVSGAPVGIVGFVFEGRPNVLVDATGVLRNGNTAVIRIGRDASETAQCMMAHAIRPALSRSGLPDDAVRLVACQDRAGTWAMLSDRRLGLAVIRGSGPAVAQLGDVARQCGVAVSVHGTGGAWLIGDARADRARFASAIACSLDRKVCNTLNVCCIDRSRVADLVPALLEALERAASPIGGFRIHVLEGSESALPVGLFSTIVATAREGAVVDEPVATTLPYARLSTEWEWSETPEISFVVVDGLDEAIGLFNQHSPRFVASLISEDRTAQKRFFDAVDAPFVGNGFTRWADGQYALDTPELGLSNWEQGRPLGRGAILSGNDIFSLRYRMEQDDITLHR
jgi:glutamate-5-semialdehyde dehydrogenase